MPRSICSSASRGSQQVAAYSARCERDWRRAATLPGVKDVRVKGAIGVVELERIADIDALRARFVEEGVFIRPFGNVIYLTPAFTIAADELNRADGGRRRVVGSLPALEPDAVPCRSYSSARSIFTVANSPTRSGRLLAT